ncbi:MAG: hypothetical protein K5831_16930 [Brevundimonas sp.]|uniref:Uncharacterized protein n=1 Tax=Brevundimonas albigilva TaxID=1312364 RepID=A0ABY4SM84_9CAUL|nr:MULTISPECIES: hypothetical protein [Brevundimonas]MCV0416549.1 hypothetical protein [Brevundimonas sp.]URI15019.1 hypothetical protein M8231_14635 [Brevundimonas albigilva]
MTDAAPKADPAEPQTLNPELRQGRDGDYAEANNGSTPLDTISVKKAGPAVWPVIWAVTTIVLVAVTLFLIFA